MSADDAESRNDGKLGRPKEEKDNVPLDASGSFWAENFKNPTNLQFGRLSKDDEQKYLRNIEAKHWGQLLKNCQDRRRELMKYSESTVQQFVAGFIEAHNVDQAQSFAS